MPSYSGVWNLVAVYQAVGAGNWPLPASYYKGWFGGGYTGATTYNIIDYVTFATTGNATDFGDLTQVTSALAGTASETRGVFGGGNNSLGNRINVISYITITSSGNALDFGDLTGVRNSLASAGSSTRGIFAGGEN